MELEQIKGVVGDTPHMSLEQARRMSRFIRGRVVRDVLELGFGHGVSTCYLAGALESQGGGTVTTIDLDRSQSLHPNINELLGRCVFPRVRVTAYFEPTSYTWRLMKFLEQESPPQFDLCYIDGAHSWFVDGFAFFLVDRLLRTGGWIIFDDLNWTFDTTPALRDSPRVQAMPEEERKVPQVGKVFELLVKRHPAYGEFKTEGGWGYARKTGGQQAAAPQQ